MKDREEAREFYKQNSLKLAEEMPQHFFEFCGHLRTAAPNRFVASISQ